MESAFRVTTTVAVYVMIGIGAVSAETLSTHRIPALLAATSRPTARSTKLTSRRTRATIQITAVT
jgi:hypothetical protein